jgi:class 3 adenylate cyclase
MTSTPAARTSTFLFTDTEGSTRLWQEDREAMAVALETHDALLRAAVEKSGGSVVKTTGDGVLAAFDRPEGALSTAIDAQPAIGAHTWRLSQPLRVRMAIHSGSADTRDSDFFGPALNRAARLLAIGHGEQVLVSSTTAALVPSRARLARNPPFADFPQTARYPTHDARLGRADCGEFPRVRLPTFGASRGSSPY